MPSRVINRFVFRPVQAALDVEFTSGRVYRYLGVPEAVARGLKHARSKGGYFNAAIRDRFRFLRLGEWEPPGEDSVPA